jgi:hypothetical protein
MADPKMLAPVIALALWTHLIWAWMYMTRLPAIRRMRLRLDPNALRGAQMAELPPRVRWKADNYNHLMEHPTVFYATAISLALLPHGAEAPALAWTYVGLRVVHSLVQTLWNKIEVRFAFFTFSVLANIALVVVALLSLSAL